MIATEINSDGKCQCPHCHEWYYQDSIHLCSVTGGSYGWEKIQIIIETRKLPEWKPKDLNLTGLNMRKFFERL